jgi:predicted transcriptional regulator
MKAVSLRLEPTQYERLRLLSFATSKPVSEMIREAIDSYLRTNQKPKPGQEWFWSEAWQTTEREAEADLAAGEIETFDNDADFLASLK